MARISNFWNMCHTKTQGLSLSHAHILEADALCIELTLLRAKNEQIKIVFTNGCYDILHPGHVDLLARAKKYGDILILALNTDFSVKSLNKGINRPVNTLAIRSFMAAHLESVDYVTSFDESTPYNIIEKIRPDVLIKGGDWPVQSIVGNDIVQSYGGKTLSLPLLEGFSTTSMIKHIQKI